MEKETIDLGQLIKKRMQEGLRDFHNSLAMYRKGSSVPGEDYGGYLYPYQQRVLQGLCAEVELPSGPNHNSGERNMSMLNSTEIQTLTKLSGQTDLDKDLLKYDNELPATLAQDLKEAMEEERKEASKAAAKTILALLKNADAVVQQKVAQIRNLRRQERQLQIELTNITRAKAYGLATNKFLPLLSMVQPGAAWNVPADDLKIPENFKVESKEAPAAAEVK